MSEYEGKHPVDFVGRNIVVGDTVAYPVRRRSAMWLASAKVNLIQKVDGDFIIEGQGQRQRVTLRHPARLIVVEGSK